MTNTQFRTVGAWAQVRGVDEGKILRSLESLHSRGLIRQTTPPLSKTEAAFLEAHSGVVDDPDALFEAQLATAIAETEQIESALTAKEVGELVNISPSRVNHRLADGDLYALSSAGRGTARKFPIWQFVGGKPIPHLGAVLKALPARFHPLEVEGFLANAIIDELTDGRPIVARDWLTSGGDPKPVIDIAEALDHGL